MKINTPATPDVKCALSDFKYGETFYRLGPTYKILMLKVEPPFPTHKCFAVELGTGHSIFIYNDEIVIPANAEVNVIL